MNQDVSRVSVEIGGNAIAFETGKLAKQASGSVVVTQGETMVLATATAGNVRDVDFHPLTVDEEERMYAAGKIPGSFFKREGRAGEKGTLTARMIDRPIRPLFPKGWRRETQLVAIPMSIDHVHPYDILAMNGASAAIQISDIPVQQPVGAVRVGQDEEGNFVVNPPEETLLDPKLDLVVAGTEDVIRQRIAVDKKRPDGRDAQEIRPISIEVGVAPRTHGSALFTRGQTQAISVVALGTTREEMRLDTLGLQTQKFYFHHYNFPPFSVGEAGRLGGPKRRDIGHGALAERALVPVVPSVEDFPYTIRVVSDILESNGSSSMASVCGSSLSLMNAGVPIERPVAGIAMGLIKEGDEYIVLSDIAGVEDHLGDMDFKVAGTENGITALQMDIKISGVTFDILRDALEQAKEGRTFILGKMAEVITEPATELSQYAPRISSIQIDVDQIGKVIGKGGETIRGLSEEFEAQIDVQDDGTMLIYAQTCTQGDALVERIRSMTKEVEVGDEFHGKVVKTTTFGAFVELSKGTDGLLHISNISPGQRAESVEDVFNRGDEVDVRVVEVDRERGRIGLRLADDPDIAGKTADELAAVGTGDRGGGGGGRGGRDRGGRGGRDGGRGGRDGGRGGRDGGGRDRPRTDHARDQR